jgi:citrate lyase subunit beta/citryl-CoA lyase
MRSKLFVPCSRPELFPKALASAADSLSFDLEDAVQESRKQEARAAIGAFLRGLSPDTLTKTLIVRSNALDSGHFEADLDAIVCHALHIVNLPKPESADDILAAADVLQRFETERGITTPIGLLANIETPTALANASAIAKASPRVVGLQVGLGDLFEDLGIDRTDTLAVHHVQFALRMAAGTAGIWAYDGAYAAIANPDGYRAEAEAARRLGFLGKTCIHPSQIAIANEVFRPSDKEIAHALRVVAAADQAEKDGVGAYTVDGQMIDPPFSRRARQIVKAAKELGLA